MKRTPSHLFSTSHWLFGVAALAVILLGAPRAQAASVVGLWRFNEGSGTNAADSSGLGNNGILAGPNAGWAPSQPGFGSALSITNDNTNISYVNIPASGSLMIGLTPTNTWTITAWAYESSDGTSNFVATYGRILVIDDGTALQLESGAAGDGEFYTYDRTTNTEWNIGWGTGNSVSPLLDQWEHWAVVYDGTNINLYRDGNEGTNGGLASQAVMSAIAYAGYQGAIHIGSEVGAGPSRTWNGLLDDVAVFDGALTQSQVQTVMAGDFSSFLGGPLNVLAEPQNQTVAAGSPAAFSIGATGSALHYQWYFDTTIKLVGQTNSSLTFPSAQPSESGLYSVVVSNATTSFTSQSARLLVYDPNTELVALWRFNEGSGTNAADSSGLENNGGLVGANVGWAASQPGFGSALSITNDNIDIGYVNVPGNQSLMIGQTATNPWTITAWAYENSDGTGDFVAEYGRILVIDDGTALQLESGASGDGEFYTWSRSPGNTAWEISWGTGNSVSPLLDQWEHWAVVYDGTNISLYRDGDLGTNGGVASQAVTAAIGYAGYQGAIHIGSELGQGPSRTWNGLLDDIAVFDVALTSNQIQTVMSGDFTAFLPHPTLSISIVGGNVVLSWPANLPNFQMQSKTDLSAAGWSNIATRPTSNGSMLSVSVPLTSGDQFFQLIAH
jgi:hypothetical protein